MLKTQFAYTLQPPCKTFLLKIYSERRIKIIYDVIVIIGLNKLKYIKLISDSNVYLLYLLFVQVS